MKTCFKCKQKLPVEEFYRHPQMGDGRLGKCKACTRADVKRAYHANRDARREYERKRTQTPERRAAQREQTRRSRVVNREKWLTRSRTAYAVRAGKLVRKPCEVCGAEQVEAHHPDYAKPLDVRWLCFKHHRAEHGQQI